MPLLIWVVFIVFAVTVSAVTPPVKAVLPGVAVTFWNTAEIGLPWTVKLTQLIFVASTSTASMFLIWAFTVVGMNRGLWPHTLILVKIIFIRHKISDLVPLLQVLREYKIGIMLA